MYPVNLIIEIQSEEELNAIRAGFTTLRDYIDSLGKDLGPNVNLSTVPDILTRHTLRLIDSSQEARVLINGKEVAKGTKEDMDSRFKTECGMHAASNVTMQEWQDGEYKQTKARLLQKIS